MRFQNWTAIITGAASGMALLASQMMAEEGAAVYMADINAAKLNQEAEAIQSRGLRAVPCVCDLRKEKEITALADRCIRETGRIDAVINFAGGFAARMCGLEDKRFLHTPVEVLDWGISVNFRAPMLMAQAVLGPMIQQRKGVIINIGSVVGETGGSVDYAAEKAGVMYGLTKAVAREGAPYGVRCCAVAPGPVLTRPEMSRMKTALGRAAEPEEVVKLVLYLCSDDASFITGVSYLIDGGRVLLNNC